MKLTADNVTEVLKKCLYETGEDTSNHVRAEGVRLKIGFDPARLNEQKTNIESMLSYLPKEFQESTGGGTSFLNACMNKDGDLWGEHSNIDELICLGQAIGKVKILLPRDMWAALPGGMPYFAVIDKQKEIVLDAQ